MSKNARDSKSAKTHEALLKIVGVTESEFGKVADSNTVKSAGGGTVKSTSSKVKSAGGSTVKSTSGKVKSADDGKSTGGKVKKADGGKVKSASDNKSAVGGKAGRASDGRVKGASDGKVRRASENKVKSTGGKDKGVSEKKVGGAGSKSANEKKAKGEGSKKVRRKNDGKAELPEEIKPERQSNKTPQVLKLLEQDKSSSNPVILAGKSRIPRQLSGREPLSRLFRRQMSDEFSDIEGTVVVNITQMAIEFLAPEILDRFNACSCDICVEEFSRIIAERVPVRFARISKGAQYRGSHELTERMEPARKMVLSEMIKELIGNKKRCFHDE